MASARQKRLRQPRSTSRQYALKIPDGQPTGMEPGFMPGEMIVVDPSRPVAPVNTFSFAFMGYSPHPRNSGLFWKQFLGRLRGGREYYRGDFVLTLPGAPWRHASRQAAGRVSILLTPATTCVSGRAGETRPN